MDAIHTLQEFMLHTKNIIYLIILAALFGMLGFWRFLNGRNDEE